ncbi:hypothetical protein PM082_011861 [Marasmius tenuissimus]|nr:hypothetical protein PM082_011861 [Marasmius tenuissimus]
MDTRDRAARTTVPKVSTPFLKLVKTSRSFPSRSQQKLAIKHCKKPGTMTLIGPGQLDIGKYDGVFEVDTHDAVSLDGLALTSSTNTTWSLLDFQIGRPSGKFSHVYSSTKPSTNPNSYAKVLRKNFVTKSKSR